MNTAAHMAVRTPGKMSHSRGDVPAGKAQKNNESLYSRTIQYGTELRWVGRGEICPNFRSRIVMLCESLRRYMRSNAEVKSPWPGKQLDVFHIEGTKNNHQPVRFLSVRILECKTKTDPARNRTGIVEQLYNSFREDGELRVGSQLF